MSFRGSHVACVAEVQDNRVAGLWLAADVGRIIHRDNVVAQIMGGMVWGLSMALVEGLDFADGAARAESIVDYPVIGADALPPLDIALIEPDPEVSPCGVGEIGVPTVIPAVCNAFECATGRAFDRLPLEVS